MTDADLIARLRESASDEMPDGSVVHAATFSEAAGRIEELLAERSAMIANVAMARERAEKAEEELAALKHDIERHIQIAADLAQENEELRERIRALLTETAGESPAPPRP